MEWLLYLLEGGAGGQMHFRQHAAGTAAADAFDVVDVHHHRPRVAFHMLALGGLQCVPGAGGHHQQRLAIAVVVFKHVPAKASNWSKSRARMSLPVSRRERSRAWRSSASGKACRHTTERSRPTLIITLLW